MTALPSIASFTAPTVTEGEFKTALSNLHLFLTGLLGTDGTQAGGQAALGALLGAGAVTKTAAYTVTADDRGRVIACSGSFTVTLPDASAVGAGFAVAVGNYGAGTIVVDPYSSQTIDGSATRTLAANTMLVACAVSGEWLTVGAAPVATATETASGIVELANAAEAAAGTDGTRALSPLRLRNALAATGSAPIFACRAWVNFNGTGTVAIRASGNVSSITDNAVGDYTVNFATAMQDASYAAIGTCNWDSVGASAVDQNVKADDHTTTSVRIRTVGRVNSDYFVDNSEVSVAIFR